MPEELQPQIPEITPQEHLMSQLGQLVPGEYDPKQHQEQTLYIDGDLHQKLHVVNAAGRYNIVYKNGRDTEGYWVNKTGATILPLSQSAGSGALEADVAADQATLAAGLSSLIERGSTERPAGKIAKFAGRLSLR